jgi:hypothetical protein
LAGCSLVTVFVSGLVRVNVVFLNFINIFDRGCPGQVSICNTLLLRFKVESLRGFKCVFKLGGSLNSLETGCLLFNLVLSIREVSAGPYVSLGVILHQSQNAERVLTHYKIKMLIIWFS